MGYRRVFDDIVDYCIHLLGWYQYAWRANVLYNTYDNMIPMICHNTSISAIATESNSTKLTVSIPSGWFPLSGYQTGRLRGYVVPVRFVISFNKS